MPFLWVSSSSATLRDLSDDSSQARAFPRPRSSPQTTLPFLLDKPTSLPGTTQVRIFLFHSSSTTEPLHRTPILPREGGRTSRLCRPSQQAQVSDPHPPHQPHPPPRCLLPLPHSLPHPRHQVDSVRHALAPRPRACLDVLRCGGQRSGSAGGGVEGFKVVRYGRARGDGDVRSRVQLPQLHQGTFVARLLRWAAS